MSKSISDAKRRANAKWNGENLGTLGCTVPKTKAEQFKKYAKDRNTTVNALLRSYIDQCLGIVSEEDAGNE